MRRYKLLALPALLLGCADVGDTLLDITYDPCAPLVLAPRADTTEEELASIDDAIAMWRAVGLEGLTREPVEGAPWILIGFDRAPMSFYGVYQDEYGDILINREMTDRRERAITIAHELGHAFGLWHVSRGERISVMNAPNLEVEPTAEDVDAVAAVWPSCAAGP